MGTAERVNHVCRMTAEQELPRDAIRLQQICPASLAPTVVGKRWYFDEQKVDTYMYLT